MKEANKIFCNSSKHLTKRNGAKNKKYGVLNEESVQML